MNRKSSNAALTLDDLSFLQFKNLWIVFTKESAAFFCICVYLFIEFFRPQSMFKWLDFLPWAQLFLILSMMAAFTDKKATFKFTPMHGFILFFTIAIHLSFLVAFNIKWSVDNYTAFVSWMIIFFLVTSIVTTKERFYLFFIIFLLTTFKIAFGTSRIWAMRGFGFSKWGLSGPPGFFTNSGELAVLMLLIFPLGYFMFQAMKDKVRPWEKWFLLAVTICPILTILGASSRGSQLALLVQFLIIFYKRIFKPKYLLVIIVAFFAINELLPEEQKQRFAEMGSDGTSSNRLLYWENGWEIIFDNPVLGIGYHNFIPYHMYHYSQDLQHMDGYSELPHNILVQMGTDAGLIGLLAYLLIVGYSLFVKAPPGVVNDYRLFAIWKGLKLGILGFFIAGQFVTIGYYPYLWVHVALQTAMIIAVSNKNSGIQRTARGGQQ